MRLRLRALVSSCLAQVLLLGGCASTPATAPPAATQATGATQIELQALEEALAQTHGEAERARIRRGLLQVAALWRPEDGELAAFATAHFLPEGPKLTATFERLEQVLEQVDGTMREAWKALRWAVDVDVGPLLPLDPLLAALNPSAHQIEDLFRTKVAFVVLLNWPLTTLEERSTQGRGWTRAQWAGDRLAGRFARRVPAEVQQEISSAGSAADLYISGYNLWMHHVLEPDGQRLFPQGKRLITHWNLRDELKAAYADPTFGLARQRTIGKVMERIVTQTIPAAVIDNPRLDWSPATNEVSKAPADTVEQDAPAGRPGSPNSAREQDVRYAALLAQFHAARRADPYSPTAPTQIRRVFELQRELTEARVEALFEQVLTSELVGQVAALAQQRLGRPLEPHDLWYDGFKARAAIPEAELDAVTRARYPTAEAFAKDMPRLLRLLGFTEARARFVSDHIRVDPSRGAGHAMPAARRGDFPRLRTRVEGQGMDYKGYNIAIHELGHNVEQVFSLYEVDHTLLAGVPNNAFTEALAFVFQARDLELLGRPPPDREAQRLQTLADFWQAWEMAGVSLVDLRVWRWLYENPTADAAGLREATVRISRELWNRHYAPVLGGKDVSLLGIYSHMISYPLYLADYPLGRMIAFQIEEHLSKAEDFGAEFERMSRHGAVTPDLWMQNATGAEISAEPLLRAVGRALK
jgi:hypothetical protein